MCQGSTTQVLCKRNGIIVTVMGLGAVDTLYLDTTVLNEHRGLSQSSFILGIWEPPSLAGQGLNSLLFELYQYVHVQHSSHKGHNAVTQLNINSNNLKTWIETWRILTFHIPCMFISADKQRPKQLRVDSCPVKSSAFVEGSTKHFFFFL